MKNERYDIALGIDVCFSHAYNKFVPPHPQILPRCPHGHLACDVACRRVQKHKIETCHLCPHVPLFLQFTSISSFHFHFNRKIEGLI